METAIKHKVLLVDDNPDDIEITRRILARVDGRLTVESAMRGEEAIELLRAEQQLPSLVLLDLKMAGMSGIDTLRLIRSDERLKPVPVVILTHSSLEADKKEAYASGANGFLQKTFDFDQFGRDLRIVLDSCLKD